MVERNVNGKFLYFCSVDDMQIISQGIARPRDGASRQLRDVHYAANI